MLTLVGLVLVASVLPVREDVAVAAGYITNAAIALLFFLHGAKLSRAAVVQGLSHWRLHGLVLSITFLFFPLLAWALQPVLLPLLGPDLYRGVMYLSVLPSTVQSAIALTSLARGNVPAAICGAATSSLLGIAITPLLVMLLMNTAGAAIDVGEAVVKITLQLFIPFVAGHMARRWIGTWVDRHKAMLKHVDQSSIYLVVYTAFSKAVVEGIWAQMPVATLLVLLLCCAVLLGVVLGVVQCATGLLGFTTEDRITALFGASQKSLATGVPMAQVLFASAPIGAMLLPLMLYHQVQLITCAALARTFQQRQGSAQGAAPP